MRRMHAPKRFFLKALPVHEDDTVHVPLVNLLQRFCARDVYWQHTPNGGDTLVWRRRAAKLGAREGAADLLFVWPADRAAPAIGGDCRVLMLELKTLDGELSAEQLAVEELAERAGAEHLTAWTLDQAVGILKQRAILPPTLRLW